MVERNLGPQAMNATFFTSHASWLSCSTAQAPGLSMAIGCESATPEFSSGPGVPEERCDAGPHPNRTQLISRFLRW